MTNRPENDSMLKLGDESVLWTFGSEAQNTLSLVSKVIASASTSEEAESTLSRIVKTADELESLGGKRQHAILARFQKDDTRESYRSILKQLNGLTVSMRLRQAELAKDLAVLERADNMLTECCDQLEECVTQGRALLAGNAVESSPYVSAMTKENANDIWLSRFSSRMESLELSRTIALQTTAQIRLLKISKQDLMQKMQTVVANVIPLWRNQVSLYLGIQQVGADNRSANRVAATAQTHIMRTAEKSRAVVNEAEQRGKVDKRAMQSLVESSTKLVEALRELRLAEEECSVNNSAALSTLENYIDLSLD